MLSIKLFLTHATILFLFQNKIALGLPKSTTNNIKSTSNKVFNKTICAQSLDPYDSEVITCPEDYKFSILNAYIFDFGNESCSIDQKDSIIPLEFIRNKIQNLCSRSETNCFIFKYYLNSLYEPYSSLTNLGSNIFWSCYTIKKESKLEKI